MNENKQKAIQLGLARYIGKPCVQGHNGERLVRNNDCVECRNNIKRRAYQRKKEKCPPRVLLTEEERKLRIKESQKKYYYTHKAMVTRKSKKAKYRASTLKRMPKWLTPTDKWMIKEAYHIATLRTKATGIIWEVDHIIPLQGKNVSGLHVPTNLQILPKSKNCSKGNRFDVE